MAQLTELAPIITVVIGYLGSAYLISNSTSNSIGKSIDQLGERIREMRTDINTRISEMRDDINARDSEIRTDIRAINKTLTDHINDQDIHEKWRGNDHGNIPGNLYLQ